MKSAMRNEARNGISAALVALLAVLGLVMLSGCMTL